VKANTHFIPKYSETGPGYSNKNLSTNSKISYTMRKKLELSLSHEKLPKPGPGHYHILPQVGGN
jgi:hypothetical protein